MSNALIKDNMGTSFIKEENRNKPATKKQLWALYVASRKNGQTHDYRADNLTMQQASALLQGFNAKTAIAKIGVNDAPNAKAQHTITHRVSKGNKLENDFLSYMGKRMEGIIATAKQAIQIKSVVEDDKEIFSNKKDRKQFAFFGFGCGITVIQYDKRSKKGKQIEELASKHHFTTFLDMFLKGFTKEQIAYLDKVGCPLSAMFMQDIRISGAYERAVASFMIEQGVKNVRTRTFDD